MLVNSASFSQEGYASATVGSKAVDGSYDFFVQQLASKSQVALQGLQDSDLGSGSLTIGQGGDAFNIDLSAAATLDAQRFATMMRRCWGARGTPEHAPAAIPLAGKTVMSWQ